MPGMAVCVMVVGYQTLTKYEDHELWKQKDDKEPDCLKHRPI